MLYAKIFKSIIGVFAFASTLVFAEVYASNVSLPQQSADAAELEKAIEELEQALVLVKHIEENKEVLGDDSISAPTEKSEPQYQSVDEQTEQDKLIAKMAERLNDVAGLSNQDGSVIISGHCLSHQDKLILKDFVEGIREQLTKITGLKFPSSAYRILVLGAIPKSRKEDTKTAHYKIDIVPDAMPHRDASTIRLIIHHPNAMDPHEFAENVIRGYLALYTYVMRNEDYTGESVELPKWFIKGLAKQIDFTSSQRDVNDILDMWSNGFIPPIEKLVGTESLLASSNGALASALVGFWLDCENPKTRISQLFAKLANGVKWTPELYKETIRQDISFNQLDIGFDYWILAQRFKVLEVGVSTETLAERVITHLMFTPGVGIVPEAAGTKWIAQNPIELAKFKNEPWAKKLAEKKQRFLLVASTGRNDEFRAAAAELVAIYQAIIVGKETEAELREKYEKAEKMLFEAASMEEK